MTQQPNPEMIDAAFSRLSKIAMARANVFQILAFAFVDPSRELVVQVQDGSFIMELEDSFNELWNRRITGEAARNMFAPLKSALVELAQKDQEALLKEMKVEYARLFIGPGHIPVSPYETSYGHEYKDSQPMLMISPEAVAVAAAYREAGVGVSRGLNEPPDHFATECEFLYYLSEKEAVSWMENNNVEALNWRRKQIAFMESHLVGWGQQFCLKVESESLHPFYKAMARISKTIVQIEGSDTIESENKPDLGMPTKQDFEKE